MNHSKRKKVASFLFALPYGLSFLGFIVLPIIVAAVLAFMQFDLTDRNSIHFVGLNNFKELWHDSYFWQAMVATLRYSVMMVPCLIITSFAMALAMNSMAKGKEVVRALVFLPGMFTIAVTAILWQWFYNQEFGLFNFLLKGLHETFPNSGLIPAKPVPWLGDRAFAMPSIVVMSLWWTAGGTSVVMLTALQQIPRMYVEAAALDGAGPGKLFSHIILPLMKPVLLFVVITNTIAAFQMFPQASLLTSGGPELTTRGMVQYIYETAFNQYRLGYAAAMSWMLAIVILIFALGQYALLRRGAT